jgi:cytochrome c
MMASYHRFIRLASDFAGIAPGACGKEPSYAKEAGRGAGIVHQAMKTCFRTLWILTLSAVLGMGMECGLRAAEPNSLTEAEKSAGWRLLFDGKTTEGWRGYNQQAIPPGWKAIDGALVRVTGGQGGKGAGGGDDIITTEQFDNFELTLEWKVAAKGNSGVLYHVTEGAETTWHVAPEMQILDNTKHPTRDKRQLAGACYDLYEPAKDVTKPVGEWNVARLLVNGAHVEHWLNGEKLLEYELWSEDWKARVAKSKFKDKADFAKAKTGHICLQEHTDRIEFRNIKLRRISK